MRASGGRKTWKFHFRLTEKTNFDSRSTVGEHPMASPYPSMYLPIDMRNHPDATIERAVSQRNQTKTTPLGNSASTNGCIRVLVADDNVHTRRLMAFIFKNFTEDTVDFAEDGEDAWSSLCAEPFDLLITDIDMPRLDGIQLAHRMRQHSFQQPVLFISGSLPENATELFESLLPCDGLEKPFSFAEMLTKVRAMSHSKAHNGTNGNSSNGTNGRSRNGTNGSY